MFADRIEISSLGTETTVIELEAKDSLIDMFDMWVKQGEPGETIEAKTHDKKKGWVVLYKANI